VLGLSKINCHLSGCICASPSILAVSLSHTDNLNLAVSFKNRDIKENRNGKYRIPFLVNLS